MRMSGTGVALCALVTTFALASCSSVPRGSVRDDKAGGRPGQVVLRLANTAYGPSDPLAFFARQVEKNSDGQVRVSLVNQFEGYAPNAQSQVIRAVVSGKVDLGWVGSQGFDQVGVSSLTAFSAPMLIDDPRLENAVLAGRTGHAMLAGLQGSGLTGLAVIPGHIRVPIGVDRALVDPRRWHGIGFGTYASQVEEQSVRALGATPVEAFGPLRSHALSVHAIAGFEMDVPGLVSLDLIRQAPYVAVNVPLWPQVDVAIANPAMLSSLTEEQRQWVQDSATEAAASVGRAGDEAKASLQGACARGARLVTASPSQLTAFRDAFKVVYANLEKDPRTQEYIAQIRRLKAALPPAESPTVPAGCAGTP